MKKLLAGLLIFMAGCERAPAKFDYLGIENSVFRIRTPIYLPDYDVATGSGFLVSREGEFRIYTCWHVVSLAAKGCLVVGGLESMFADFECIPDTDIAFSVLAVKPESWIPLKEATPIANEVYRLVGFPGDKSGLSIITGRVTSRQENEPAYLMSPKGVYYGLSGNAIGGFSGGPVLNSRGAVIGMLAIGAQRALPIQSFMVRED